MIGMKPIMQSLYIVRLNRQLDMRCSQQTYHRVSQPHCALRPNFHYAVLLRTCRHVASPVADLPATCRGPAAKLPTSSVYVYVFPVMCIVTYPLSPLKQLISTSARNGTQGIQDMSYRKDDRAMRPIYGCPENFRESLSTPTNT